MAAAMETSKLMRSPRSMAISRADRWQPGTTTGGTDREVKARERGGHRQAEGAASKNAPRTSSCRSSPAQARPERSVPPHTLRLRVENEIYDPPQEAEGDQVTARLMVAATVTSFSNSELTGCRSRCSSQPGRPVNDSAYRSATARPANGHEAEDQHMQLRIPGEGLLVRRAGSTFQASRRRCAENRIETLRRI